MAGNITTDIVKSDEIIDKNGTGAPKLTNGLKLGSSTDTLSTYQVISTMPTAAFATPGTSSFVISGSGVKIGRLFFFNYEIKVTPGTASGGLVFTFPVSSANNGSPDGFERYVLHINMTLGTMTGVNGTMSAWMSPGTPTITPVFIADSNQAYGQITAAMFSGTVNLTLTGWYFI